MARNDWFGQVGVNRLMYSSEKKNKEENVFEKNLKTLWEIRTLSIGGSIFRVARSTNWAKVTDTKLSTKNNL